MEKILYIGTIDTGSRRGARIFCKAKIKEGNLSITGVMGPLTNGNSLGGCGQIDGEFLHRNEEENDKRYTHLISPEEIGFAPGWDKGKWFDFLSVWHRWHLNDMRAGCEHQRARGWDKRPIDPSKPTSASGKHFEGQKQNFWNRLGWISPMEHPEGLLGKPCPFCGYKYGTQWLKEDLPQDVIDFIANLPDSTITPAWI